MTECGWLWIYCGLAIALAELVSPGFVLVFFGLSAMTVGALRLAFGASFDATWQFATFSVLSVVYIALLRRWLKSIFVGDKVDSNDGASGECVGRFGKMSAAAAPGVPGRVLVGDAEWDAECASPVAAGAPVRIVAQRNITLTVEEVEGEK